MIGNISMHGEIITIGDELTAGRTVDLNAWYAAGKIASSGLEITRVTSVGDNTEMVSEALKRACLSSRFVIVTGGLGSTRDDITSEIVAGALKRPLSSNLEMLDKIRHFVKKRGIEMTPCIEKMANLPDGATLIHPDGAVCGYSLVEKDVHLYFLPGVPNQMRYLLDTFVIPDILALYDTIPVMKHRVLKVYGLNEPIIAEKLESLGNETGEAVLGFYPHFPENHITITLHGEEASTVSKKLDWIEAQIIKILGDYVFTSDNKDIEEVVGDKLKGKGWSIGLAESCTGGLISDRLTDVAGSSGYFQGGVVCYSNSSKEHLLGVRKETLVQYGAVSSETAREMAVGIRTCMKTDLGIAVTGIAGPDGGSKKKPVGTVHIGLSSENDLFTQQYRFRGSRSQVKLNAAMMALDWVRRTIDGHSIIPGI